MKIEEKLNLVCDIDGILTGGGHVYSHEGKSYKTFGSNEKCALRDLHKYFNKVMFCSADSSFRGQQINMERMNEFKDSQYFKVSTEDRQAFVDQFSPCVYLGDGIREPSAFLNVCLSDSTPQAKLQANVVLPTTGGSNVLAHLLNYMESRNIITFAEEISRKIKENGKVILCGVGKNYSLATLVSEFFLPYNLSAIPLDANHSLHGSLGIIGEDDVLICSSKSGNTKELIQMMKYLNRKLPNFNNSFLITSNKNSELEPMFDGVLVLDELKEDSKYSLSPQTTVKQYLDAYFTILNIINKSNSCTKEGYLLNHQGGEIGRCNKI